MRSTPFRVAVAFACALIVITYAVFAFVYPHLHRSNVAVVRANPADEVRKSKDLPTDRLIRRLEPSPSEDLRRIDYVGL